MSNFSDALDDCRSFLARLGYEPDKGYWAKASRQCIRDSQVVFHGGEPLFKESVLDEPRTRKALAGERLEKFQMELEETVDQVKKAKEELRSSINEMASVFEILHPKMKSMIETMRSSRMTIVTETKESLKAMADVRQFFLESDYATEMQRLERFVAICKELKVLKDQGVLDDVADISVRMALREQRSA